MNYTVVKQFYNNSIDNFYNFFYKIIDFAKVLVEVFWAFYEIWEAFFLIFFNLIMYLYYIILFIIDRSTESRWTIFFWRRLPRRVAYTPSKVFVKDAYNPVPAMYGSTAPTIATVAAPTIKSTVTDAVQQLRSAPSGARVSIPRKIVEFLGSLFSTAGALIIWPMKRIGTFLSGRMKPVREQPEGRSLIDEYLKEYEEKKRS
jgi:hypothetical protein